MAVVPSQRAPEAKMGPPAMEYRHALPSTAISAAIGVTTLTVTGEAGWHDYLHILFTWWTGDLASDLVVAPLLLIWIRRRSLDFSYPRAAEGVALLTLVIATSLMRFSGALIGPMQNYPIGFLSQPLFIWARHRHPTVNFFVRKLVHAIPHQEPPERNPFKAGPGGP